MRLRNLNVAPRAACFFGLIIVLMFVLGLVAVIQMKKLNDAKKDVDTNWMASTRQAALINAGVLKLRLESLRATTPPDTQLRANTMASFSTSRAGLMDLSLL